MLLQSRSSHFNLMSGKKTFKIKRKKHLRLKEKIDLIALKINPKLYLITKKKMDKLKERKFPKREMSVVDDVLFT